jgi:hypothetical protein
MSPIMIGSLVCIGVGLVIFITIFISIMRDSRRATDQYNAFRNVFLGMLNDEALASMNLDSGKLSNLYDGLVRLSATMAEIKESSRSTEMSLLSAMMVDRINGFALERHGIEAKLAELEEKILAKIESEEEPEEIIELTEADEIIELTELVEEEPIVIELTEEDEIKPILARHWGEVCVPKPPHKPMAKRRWGQVRMMSNPINTNINSEVPYEVYRK